MRRSRRILRAFLGSRLPTVRGSVRVEGLHDRIRIARDGFGIPHIRAESTADAWFGMGFCQGQDRSFQLEFLQRALHGRLAALMGPPVLPLDRLLRRLGLGRSAAVQLGVVDRDVRERCEAFAAGVNAARAHHRRPHELALLFGRPTPWTGVDALGMSKLAAFMLSINWTTKIARQLVLQADGPEALLSLEPVYAPHHPVGAASSVDAGPSLAHLLASLQRVEATLAPRGASNAWALGGDLTASGSAVMACDPHVNPGLPCFVYLGHLRTPQFDLCGAAFVGGPGIAFGHNGNVAWSATSGLTDTADLYLEEPDGDGEFREEVIEIRGRKPVVEHVLVTARGPVIGPAVDGAPALSIRAPWLQARPIRGFLGCEDVQTFDDLRQRFRAWPSAPLNLIGADTTGVAGWQLVGEVPKRSSPTMLPMPVATAEVWQDVVAFDEMPGGIVDRDRFVGSANNQPGPDGTGPWLGADWSTGYRVARIRDALSDGASRDVSEAQRLQRDVDSTAWRDVKRVVLAADAVDADARIALELLGSWDGQAGADSVAASVFEIFVASLVEAIVRRRAPRAFRYAMGGGVNARLPFHGWAARMCGNALQLAADQPDGWFDVPWSRVLGEQLSRAVSRIRERCGDDRSTWAWGTLRPLVLKHPLGEVPGLGRVFDLGPVPWGGDTGTLAMGTPHPLDPFANPIMIPTLRMAIDLADPDGARVSVAGGQSGNPCSVHYDDLWGPFVEGTGVPLAYTQAAVDAATVDVLEVQPG